MQDYAGGGLSVFTGFSAFAASTSKNKYLLSKFDDKVLSYGIQANVADFAYAKSQATTSKRASAAGANIAVLANAKASAMFAGGLFNSGVALMAGELTDGYTLAQAFVGGALVGYAGTSYYAKKAGMKGKYLFKSKADKVFERGLSNIATNFAFTDKSEYTKMSFHGRFGAPFAYGVVGYLADEVYMPFDAIKGLRNKNLGAIIGTSMYSFGFSTEYIGMTFSKGYYDEFKDAKGGKWKKKAAIIGWKSVFYGLTLY